MLFIALHKARNFQGAAVVTRPGQETSMFLLQLEVVILHTDFGKTELRAGLVEQMRLWRHPAVGEFMGARARYFQILQRVRL